MVAHSSQGTVIHVVSAPSTPYPTCNDALRDLWTNGERIVCPQGISDLSNYRNSSERLCLGKSEATKTLGDIDSKNITIDMLFDPDDIQGQSIIRTAFKNNNPLMYGISAGKIRMLIFKGFVSSMKITIEQNSAVKFHVGVVIIPKIEECRPTITHEVSLTAIRERTALCTFGLATMVSYPCADSYNCTTPMPCYTIT